MYNSLISYNGNHFDSYQDALNSGAVYSTSSYMDALTFDSGSTSGLFDMLEVVQLFANASGSDDLIFGVLHDCKFYPLENLAENSDKYAKSCDVDDLFRDAEEQPETSNK